jgi:cytochrome P450
MNRLTLSIVGKTCSTPTSSRRRSRSATLTGVMDTFWMMMRVRRSHRAAAGAEAPCPDGARRLDAIIYRMIADRRASGRDPATSCRCSSPRRTRTTAA